MARHQVEDLPQQADVDHEAGEGHEAGQGGEVAAALPAGRIGCGQQAQGRRGRQDPHLRGRRQRPPVEPDEEERARRQGQGVQQRRDPHPQGELLLPLADVHVETPGQLAEQGVVVGRHPVPLRLGEGQHALPLQRRDLGAERGDAVRPPLGVQLGSGRGGRGVGHGLRRRRSVRLRHRPEFGG